MFYLYVKSHNITGLKYLGKTEANPFNYKGSGTYWKRHIKVHGYDVTTDIIFETENKEELRNTGIYFSELYNVVKSDEWANLKEENGDGSGKGFIHSEKTKKLMSEIHKNNPNQGKWNIGKKRSEEHKRMISKKNKGNNHNLNQPRSIESRKKQSESRKGISSGMKGKHHSEETKIKQAEKLKGNKNSYGTIKSEYTILKLSKTFKITSPSGKEFIIVNLQKFCRENSLSRSHIVDKNGYKGWKAELLKPTLQR